MALNAMLVHVTAATAAEAEARDATVSHARKSRPCHPSLVTSRVVTEQTKSRCRSTSSAGVAQFSPVVLLGDGVVLRGLGPRRDQPPGLSPPAFRAFPMAERM